MPRLVADRLPDELVRRLGADAADARAGHATLVCSVDAHGWPHPAMLGAFELVAIDGTCLRLAAYEASRTSGHLTANGLVTLMMVDKDMAYYVKGRAVPSRVPVPAGHAIFDVRVEHVTADHVDTGREGDARILCGIQYEANDAHWEKARAILEAMTGKP